MKLFPPSLITIFALAVTTVAARAATVIFSEDFESYTVNSNLVTNTKWGSVSANSPNFLTIKQDTGNIFGLGTTNQYLDVSDTSTELTRMDAKPTSGFQFATLELDFYETPGFTGAYWGVSLTNAFPLQLNGGGIRTIGSGAYTPDLYTVGVLHRLSLTFNNTTSTQTYNGSNSLASQTFDVWIDGILVIDNAAFTGAAVAGTDLSTFSLSTPSSAFSQEMYIDNIVLTAIPEPSSVSLAIASLAGVFCMYRWSRRIRTLA